MHTTHICLHTHSHCPPPCCGVFGVWVFFFFVLGLGGGGRGEEGGNGEEDNR